MSFASSEYLPFLLLSLALFQFVPARGRVLFLGAASYAFYAWWSPAHLALLGLSTGVDYLVGRALGRARGRARRAWLALSLGCNLGLLALFKYAGFALDNLRPFFDGVGLELPADPGWALPLGISFYTFQTLGYTLDVYRGRIEPCRSLVDFAAYVAFFPQLVAGPIERAGHLLPQLRELRLLELGNLSAGARLILWGLFKKRVLADQLGPELWPLFHAPEAHSAPVLILVAIGMYALLYLDFSAYTDLARGSARLFGVELVRNFEAPFLGRSLTDFARRWHTSLFRWIGDYVHAPLSSGGLSHLALWRANLVTMGLFGHWHGASWSFVVWGLASGALISVEHSLRLLGARRGWRLPTPGGWGARVRALAGWCWAILASSALITLFFSRDLGQGLHYLAQVAHLRLPAESAEWQLLGRFAAILAGLFGVHALAHHAKLEAWWLRITWLGRTAWLLGLAWVVLRYMELQNRPFVYFQF